MNNGPFSIPSREWRRYDERNSEKYRLHRALKIPHISSASLTLPPRRCHTGVASKVLPQRLPRFVEEGRVGFPLGRLHVMRMQMTGQKLAQRRR